ncbi:hypothetical protein EDD11_003454 [Mortierella claussenii]|nr:hypothetical protein EDD11_003454 [Mortierella claussenii]
MEATAQQPQQQQQQQQQQSEQVFKKFEAYDFEGDATFQTGLKSIVGNNQNKTEKEQQEAIQSAKYFYFARFVQPFDLKEYQAWRAQSPEIISGLTASKVTNQEHAASDSITPSTHTTNIDDDATAAVPAADPTYPKSFQEICELIAAGKPIPGIRQIPNNLAEGTPSEAKLAPKLKPWEQKRAAAAAVVSSGKMEPSRSSSTTEASVDA